MDAYPNPTISFNQLAYDVDRQHNLRFTGNYYANLISLNEKWVKGDDAWYFIRPDGQVFRWMGSIDKSQLVATLNASFYADPNKLYEAQMPV